MKSDFLLAVTQLAAERGLPRESVVAAVEAALISAYKKDALVAGHDITVKLDPGSGEVQVFVQKSVVEVVEDSRLEMTLVEAQQRKKDAALGDVLEYEGSFPSAGRIAAQTAKQVVLQRLREAERELVVAEYANRVGDLIAGRVERSEAQQVVISLGRADGIMPKEEQVPTERYRPNQTLQFYLLEVTTTSRGPEVILSRSHRDLIRRLFEREVPEIYKGIVEIQSIAREPGARSKVAVTTRQAGVDPVGSCVGLRGFRIQNIVNEIQGETIDVVQGDSDISVFLANSLSPAQVLKVELDHVNKAARLVVPDRQLSLAIGREGQNVRLAAKLTGWKLDIASLSEYEGVEETETVLEEVEATQAAVAVAEPPPAPEVPAEAPQPVEAIQQEAVQVVEEIVEAPGGEPQEAMPAAAEVDAPAAQDSPALAAEEELLAAAVPEIEKIPQPVETPGFAPDDERIWRIPKQLPPSVLRFAEDIMPERARSRGRGGRDDERRGRTGKNRTAVQTPDQAQPQPQTEEEVPST